MTEPTFCVCEPGVPCRWHAQANVRERTTRERREQEQVEIESWRFRTGGTCSDQIALVLAHLERDFGRHA